MTEPPTTTRAFAAERLSGRLLIGLTYVSVGLLVIGVVLMVADGISPLASTPTFEPGTLVASLVGLDPEAFLWLGLVAVIATPLGRVMVAGVAYAADAEWLMVVISIAILLVIAFGVGTAVAGTV
jgi:uncharacterized membrane protein